MAIRKLQVLGESEGGSRSFGVSIDKSELRAAGLVDDDDQPADVPLAIRWEDRDRWVVEPLDAQ